MSLDTYIQITQLGVEEYRVSLCSGDLSVGPDLGIRKSLEEAVRLANKHIQDSEYGIAIALLPKKRTKKTSEVDPYARGGWCIDPKCDHKKRVHGYY